MMPRYRYGVSEFTTMPWTFEQDIERYAQLGVEAIEVCEIKLDERRRDEQLALIAQHGLAISSVQPRIRTLFPSQSQPEPLDPRARMALFSQTIQRFGPLAQGVPFVTNTGSPPGGNIQRVYDVGVEVYRELADEASRFGARIALEPLNPSIMNVETAIWTIQQALHLVTQVARSNFGVCIDSWNVWQNADLFEAIAACGDRIFVVQLSDWRTPRSFQDRLSIGQGEIPFPAFLRAIHASGFTGPYVLEIFSADVPDPLWEGDLKQLIRDNRTNLGVAWQAAFTS
ncbi:MAG TPA: sugar phosphate isomerase/epimerase family protein [Ktedonobacterales bacterium]|nr:sugar phosphate isomerase/epimerase family protein [Ktedonobacterales bacterium]